MATVSAQTLPSPDASSQAEKNQSEDVVNDKEKEVDASKKPPVSKAKPPKKIFTPSEEISEDSPAPFPVDI